MIGASLILTLAYVAVAVLLLNLSLATRYGGRIKLAAIVLVSLLYFGTWHGFRGLIGWPSPDPMPENFRVLWIALDNPDKLGGDTAGGGAGSIYYWVRELDAAGLPVGAPRAHALPWNEEAAEAAQAALDRMDAGERLNGRRTRNFLAPLDDAATREEGERGDRLSAGTTERPPAFEFFAVRPPTLPSKGRVPNSD